MVKRYVAVDKEHGIVRTIVSPCEAQGIGGSIGTQLFSLAKDVMP